MTILGMLLVKDVSPQLNILYFWQEMREIALRQRLSLKHVRDIFIEYKIGLQLF